MRVWVSGARGFVGSRLVARLQRDGVQVVACDLEVDVTDGRRVARAVAAARPDALVHLAAVTFVPEASAHPATAFRVNYLGSLHVLEAARQEAPRARVLIVGSGAAYGPTSPGAPPFDESAPLRPASAYARAKACADLLGGAFATRGLDVVRARPFNHTGPGRPDHFVESSFARQLVEMEAGQRAPRLAVGNLDAARDFLHVDDVVDAYCQLLRPEVPPAAYNVASGRATPLRKLLGLLLKHVRVEPEVVVEQARWRSADVLCGSPRRLSAATGWTPARGLEKTLVELLAFWRAELGRLRPQGT